MQDGHCIEEGAEDISPRRVRPIRKACWPPLGRLVTALQPFHGRDIAAARRFNTRASGIKRLLCHRHMMGIGVQQKLSPDIKPTWPFQKQYRHMRAR